MSLSSSTEVPRSPGANQATRSPGASGRHFANSQYRWIPRLRGAPRLPGASGMQELREFPVPLDTPPPGGLPGYRGLRAGTSPMQCTAWYRWIPAPRRVFSAPGALDRHFPNASFCVPPGTRQPLHLHGDSRVAQATCSDNHAGPYLLIGSQNRLVYIYIYI